MNSTFITILTTTRSGKQWRKQREKGQRWSAGGRWWNVSGIVEVVVVVKIVRIVRNDRIGRLPTRFRLYIIRNLSIFDGLDRIRWMIRKQSRRIQ